MENRQAQSRSIMKVLVIGIVAIVISVFAFDSFKRQKMLRIRSEGKVWYRDNVNRARVDFDHLRKLARMVDAPEEDSEIQKVLAARTIVCDLVRLPGELVEGQFESKGKRWHEIKTAVLSDEACLEFDEIGRVWRILDCN